MFLNSRFTIAGMRLRNPLKTYHDAALTLRSGPRGGPRKTVRGWSQTAAVTQSKASWNSPTPVPAAVTLRSGTLRSPRQTDSGVFDRRFRTLPLEHDDVLPRENLNCLRPIQRLDGHLFAHLGLGHFVNFLDGHLRIFGAELYEDHPPARLQRLADALHHFERIIELVIDVHHQHKIDGAGREFRVGDRPPQAFDVGDFAFRHFFGEQIEHFLLDIDGINKALCAR